jgi:hypothetical protein
MVIATQTSEISRGRPCGRADIRKRRKRLTQIHAAAGHNSSQAMELAMAATEVVFRRMTLGGLAMVYPLDADHGEFARMVPEKTQAFSDAGSIMISQSARISQDMTRLFTDEMTLAAEATTAALTTLNPARIIAAQTDAGMSWAARLASLPGTMCLLALQAHAAVMAPIHRAATDNVERLRNRDTPQ